MTDFSDPEVYGTLGLLCPLCNCPTDSCQCLQGGQSLTEDELQQRELLLRIGNAVLPQSFWARMGRVIRQHLREFGGIKI